MANSQWEREATVQPQYRLYAARISLTSQISAHTFKHFHCGAFHCEILLLSKTLSTSSPCHQMFHKPPEEMWLNHSHKSVLYLQIKRLKCACFNWIIVGEILHSFK